MINCNGGAGLVSAAIPFVPPDNPSQSAATPVGTNTLLPEHQWTPYSAPVLNNRPHSPLEFSQGAVPFRFEGTAPQTSDMSSTNGPYVYISEGEYLWLQRQASVQQPEQRNHYGYQSMQPSQDQHHLHSTDGNYGRGVQYHPTSSGPVVYIANSGGYEAQGQGVADSQLEPVYGQRQSHHY